MNNSDPHLVRIEYPQLGVYDYVIPDGCMLHPRHAHWRYVKELPLKLDKVECIYFVREIDGKAVLRLTIKQGAIKRIFTRAALIDELQEELHHYVQDCITAECSTHAPHFEICVPLRTR